MNRVPHVCHSNKELDELAEAVFFFSLTPNMLFLCIMPLFPVLDFHTAWGTVMSSEKVCSPKLAHFPLEY
jgi:hypothetical protein